LSNPTLASRSRWGRFSGTFNGRGFKLRLEQNIPLGGERAGVFGYLGNAKIYNLITEGYIICSRGYVGVLGSDHRAGYDDEIAAPAPVISGCINYASITVLNINGEVGAPVGGFIGIAGCKIEIHDCINIGNITINRRSHFSGGIIG
jgi:hypothetical protein